jgi:SAM-dependent methyltransferase
MAGSPAIHGNMNQPPGDDGYRSPEQLRQHYEVERELSDRLRHAPRAERLALYATVYEELFARVPHHPQLRRKTSAHDTEEAITGQMRFLKRFLSPSSVFLEIGAGDCSLSLAVAGLVRKVYALDVSPTITRQQSPPGNFELVLSDGIGIPLEAGSVTVAYSNQLMEHLHPDDALEQLREIHRSLAPGGAYICITPHRMSGPHDVSRYFDDVATGFHLAEYTPLELSRIFKAAGFSRTRTYLGGKGRFAALVPSLLNCLEWPFTLLPRSLRVGFARRSRLGFLKSIWIVGYK